MPASNGASEEQKEQLFAAVKGKFGFVPNLIKELVKSPAATKVYLQGSDILSSGSLSGKEGQAVELTVATFNECHYCTAAHGTAALGAGVSEDDVSAILTGGSPDDATVAAVVDATRLVLGKKGWLEVHDLESLDKRGITRTRLYEIIAYVGLKTLTNYVNHIAETEVDEQFAKVTRLPAYQEAIGQVA